MVNKLKVLHFMTRGDIGGQEKALYELFKAFRDDDNIEVGVALGRDKGILIKKINELGIPIVRLNIKGGFDFKIKKKVLRKLKMYNIHHFHDPSPIFIIYSLLSGLRIKRIFTRRGGNITYKARGLKIRIKYIINKLLIKNTFHGFSGNTINAV